jgi:hypothetical protein
MSCKLAFLVIFAYSLVTFEVVDDNNVNIPTAKKTRNVSPITATLLFLRLRNVFLNKLFIYLYYKYKQFFNFILWSIVGGWQYEYFSFFKKIKTTQKGLAIYPKTPILATSNKFFLLYVI